MNRVQGRGARVARWRGGLVVVALVLLGFPAAAAGDVLVNAIEPPAVACGKSVTPGVWYQSFSGGPRWAHMTIKNSHGIVVWRKNVTATTSWRYWRYRGACGAHYELTYTTADGTSKFPFRFKSG
jgi:hypothetical protein